jgi:hypothetical protein
MLWLVAEKPKDSILNRHNRIRGKTEWLHDTKANSDIKHTTIFQHGYFF